MAANRRTFLLSLAGIAPGLVLPSPGKLQAGNGIKKFIRTLETESIIQSKPEKNSAIFLKNIDDAIAVLYKNGVEQPVCALNRAGKMIWDACDNRHTPHDISEILRQTYKVSSDQALADCIALLKKLNHIGAILI